MSLRQSSAGSPDGGQSRGGILSARLGSHLLAPQLGVTDGSPPQAARRFYVNPDHRRQAPVAGYSAINQLVSAQNFHLARPVLMPAGAPRSNEAIND